MGKAKRTLGVILAALMLVVTCMTYVPASAAVVLPTVKFVGLQNIPAAVGEDQTLFLTSSFDGNVQYQVFYVQRNDPSKAATTTWTKLGDWTTAADAKTPVEVKVPKGTITVAGNYSFAIRVKRAGVTGQNSNTYGDFDSAYAFNYVFAAAPTEGLKAATLASAEVTVGENFVINGLTAGSSYKLFTLNEARAERWDKTAVATSTTNTIKWIPTAAGSYVLDLQLVDAAGKVTAVKLFNVKVTDTFKVTSVNATSATQLLVKFNKPVLEGDAETPAYYSIGGKTPSGVVMATDGLSAVITMKDAEPVNGTVLYIVQPLKLAADATVKTPIFTYVETYTDTVAPAVSKITYPTYDKAVVTFTEPLSGVGNLTITQNGAALTFAVAPKLSDDGLTLTFDLKNDGSTPAVAIPKDKPITVVMVGAKDKATNLMNPNPTTITLTKVQSDTTAPTVVEVKALSDTRVSVKFSEELIEAPTATINGGLNGMTWASDDDITWTATFTVQPAGVAAFAVTAAKDLSANTLAATYSKLLQLTQDTTAPVLASSKVKTFNSKQYLVLTFNEDVTAQNSTVLNGTYVKDYVTKTITPAVNLVLGTNLLAYTKANKADVDDSKSVMIDITALTAANYTLTIPEGIVKDLASTPVVNAAFNVTLAQGDISVNDTGLPTVASASFGANNATFTVLFSEAMDPATALNVNNYKVGGACIFSNAIFDGDALTVKLTVVPGTIVYTGDYSLSISGVKDAAGNVMDAHSATLVGVKENVKPYIASAKLTDSKTIVVTMSEAVTGLGELTKDGDIAVYVAGTQLTATTDYTVTYTNGVATITLSDAKKITDLTKTIQVKLVDATVADNNTNLAVTGTLVTVTP